LQVTRLVKNNAGLFTGVGEMRITRPNLLQVQGTGLGGAQHQPHLHAGLIKANANHVAGGQHQQLLLAQIGVELLALLDRGVAATVSAAMPARRKASATW
jgi:hypothetical protein